MYHIIIGVCVLCRTMSYCGKLKFGIKCFWKLQKIFASIKTPFISDNLTVYGQIVHAFVHRQLWSFTNMEFMVWVDFNLNLIQSEPEVASNVLTSMVLVVSLKKVSAQKINVKVELDRSFFKTIDYEYN